MKSIGKSNLSFRISGVISFSCVLSLILLLPIPAFADSALLYTFDCEVCGGVKDWVGSRFLVSHSGERVDGKMVLTHAAPEVDAWIEADVSPYSHSECPYWAISLIATGTNIAGSLPGVVLGFSDNGLEFFKAFNWDQTSLLRLDLGNLIANGPISKVRIDLPRVTSGLDSNYDFENARYEINWIAISSNPNFNNPIEDVSACPTVSQPTDEWWMDYTTLITNPSNGVNEAEVKPDLVRNAGWFGGWYGFWYQDDQLRKGFPTVYWPKPCQQGKLRLFYFDDGEIGDYAVFLSPSGNVVFDQFSIVNWNSSTPTISQAQWFGLENFMGTPVWSPYPTADDYGLPTFTHPDVSPMAPGQFYNVMSRKGITGNLLPVTELSPSNISDQLAADSGLDQITSKDSAGRWITNKLWHVDTANPQMTEYRVAEMEHLLDSIDTPNGVHIDNWGANNLWQPALGAFGDWSLHRFREFMSDRFTPQEMVGLGIVDIQTFDIRSYLTSTFPSLTDPASSEDPLWNLYKLFKAQAGLEHAGRIYNTAKSSAAASNLNLAVTGNIIPLWPGAALNAEFVDIANFEWLVDGSYPQFSPMGFPDGRAAYITRLGAQMSQAPYCWASLYVSQTYQFGYPALHKLMAFDAFANRCIMDWNYRFEDKFAPGTEESARSINDFIRSVAPMTNRREYVADIGLVFNPWCDVAASVVQYMQNDLFLNEYSGWADYLVRTHSQWDLLLSQDITLKNLNRFQVVILPSLIVISDGEAQVFADYVNEGGQLVITGDSGTRFGPDIHLTPLSPRPTNALNRITSHPNVHVTSNKPGQEYRKNCRPASAANEMNTLLANTGLVPSASTNAPESVGVNMNVSADGEENRLTLDLNNYDYDLGTDTFTQAPATEVTVTLPTEYADGEITISYVYPEMLDLSNPIPLPTENIDYDQQAGTITLSLPAFTTYLLVIVELTSATFNSNWRLY